MFEFVDSRESFATEEYHAWLDGVETRLLEAEMSYDDYDDYDYGDDYDDYDGQPSEYEEWQDVFGGDVEEYGTFGEYDYE